MGSCIGNGRPLWTTRECEICERLLGAREFTDPRDPSICHDCWRDHDAMIAGEGAS